MFLKVDVESGKVYFKKSKDGPEDKYFVHNKSKSVLFSEDNKTCNLSFLIGLFSSLIDNDIKPQDYQFFFTGNYLKDSSD